MTDRQLLRLAATLLLGGLLFTFIVGLFHPDTRDPNNHVAEFALYAQSQVWTAVHLGQFIGMVIIIGGLLVLCFALNLQAPGPLWMSRCGAIAAVIALSLYGALQAVDGVALKHAVDAWARAPAAEQGARFASAEAIRWLEWGLRSYQSFMLGLSLVLFALALVWAVRLPRPIGYLMGLTGLAYIVQGWVLGAEGFSPNNTVPTLLGYLFWLVWSVWLLLVAWRLKEAPASVSHS